MDSVQIVRTWDYLANVRNTTRTDASSRMWGRHTTRTDASSRYVGKGYPFFGRLHVDNLIMNYVIMNMNYDTFNLSFLKIALKFLVKKL